jgi:hypothetical protein
MKVDKGLLPVLGVLGSGFVVFILILGSFAAVGRVIRAAPEPKVTLCELDGHIWLYPDPQPTDIVVEGAEFPTGPGDVEYWQCRVCKKWRVVPLGCK